VVFGKQHTHTHTQTEYEIILILHMETDTSLVHVSARTNGNTLEYGSFVNE